MHENQCPPLFCSSTLSKNIDRCRNTWRRRIAALVIALACCPGAGFGQTVFLDFNIAGQYTSDFNPWNDTGGANGGNYSFTEGTSAGVNGSGGISVFQNNDTTATYNQGS